MCSGPPSPLPAGGRSCRSLRSRSPRGLESLLPQRLHTGGVGGRMMPAIFRPLRLRRAALAGCAARRRHWSMIRATSLRSPQARSVIRPRGRLPGRISGIAANPGDSQANSSEMSGAARVEPWNTGPVWVELAARHSPACSREVRPARLHLSGGLATPGGIMAARKTAPGYRDRGDRKAKVRA